MKAQKSPEPIVGTDFIRQIIAEDLASKKHGGRVVTRFPPEPNGYLHIGHAKSICLNFGVAQENSGVCHLRFDDTNPIKEDVEYVRSIEEDVVWLGFDWGDKRFYASDYFEKLYDYASDLIRRDKAYVCSLSAEEIRDYRGTLTEPGRDSPDRHRSAQESLDLFAQMRDGAFEDGAYTLRARIDMASPNITMRDPTIYRIRRTHHHRSGDSWCIYPMYDFAHCLSDSIEGITHSLCTLEFEDHRPLYDWILDSLELPCHPQQIEFARLNLTHTVLSKRKLVELVRDKKVDGWDDPRLPTIAGMRRRGYPAAALRNFCTRIGLAKRDSLVDIAMLEHAVREQLNQDAPRFSCVLDPVRLVIENFPENRVEMMQAINNPEDPSKGSREVPFSRVLYLDRADFREDPPRKFYRLAPGREVRLRYAYFITCTGFDRDPESGEVTEIRCTYDPETRGGSAADGRKVKSTLHWVSAPHALDCEVRLYDRLFNAENPGQEKDPELNPDSLIVRRGCKVEPSITTATETPCQFERVGYFYADSQDSRNDALVFNRTVSLRDTWARLEKRAAKQKS